MEAVANGCPDLEVLNLSYTAVPPTALVPLLLKCKRLEVLKAAGISNWVRSRSSICWSRSPRLH